MAFLRKSYTPMGYGRRKLRTMSDLLNDDGKSWNRGVTEQEGGETTKDELEQCPVCGDNYNHVVRNGYRNRWPETGFEVCTPTDSDWMYVHTDG